MIDLRTIAHALNGDVAGRDTVVAPGPGHSNKDRSLAIKLDATAPNGFLIFSHCGDDWKTCRDHVRSRLGLPPWEPIKPIQHKRERTALAAWLWQQARPAFGTIVQTYLASRGIACMAPATIRFLPARDEYPPAMITAFGFADEPEPEVLAIKNSAVKAVHVTKLKPDGSGKADVPNPKIIIGSPAGLPLMLAPMNDLMGLAICEGVEDALSVHQATGLGVWAAGSAPFMPKLVSAIEHLATAYEYDASPDSITIYVDDDDSGRRHAKALAEALAKLSRVLSPASEHFDILLSGGHPI